MQQKNCRENQNEQQRREPDGLWLCAGSICRVHAIDRRCERLTHVEFPVTQGKSASTNAASRILMGRVQSQCTGPPGIMRGSSLISPNALSYPATFCCR